MRTILSRLLAFLAFLAFMAVLALPARGQETPPKPKSTAEPVPAEAAKVAEEAAEPEFVPPDGWRPKKRGKFTVYCRKEYNAKGTRFPQETCYDEAGIRAMLAAQLDDREKVDQLRRICGSQAACGAN